MLISGPIALKGSAWPPLAACPVPLTARVTFPIWICGSGLTACQFCSRRGGFSYVQSGWAVYRLGFCPAGWVKTA